MVREGRPQVHSSLLQSDEVLHLVDAAKAGDEEAMHRLVAEAMAFVYPAVLSMLRARKAAHTYLSDTMQGDRSAAALEEDAWELTHATCLAMLDKLHTFRGRDLLGRSVKFSTWVYAIAQNQVRAALRRRWREHRRRAALRARPDADAPAAEDPPEPDAVASPEELAVERSERALVRQALAEAPLTPEQRDAVVMFYVLGYSQAQIAERTGVQVGTVKKRIFDGVRKLRLYIEGRSSARADVGGM